MYRTSIGISTDRDVFPKLELRQPGVLGLVDYDTVAGLVNVVVQPEVGSYPGGKGASISAQ